ncbi:hypothetical protein BC940DRAFT_370267 [Gongronella butleri]|nr:hypothetical protein BC940DRAFT_370267 [Gongronella butleri]
MADLPFELVEKIFVTVVAVHYRSLTFLNEKHALWLHDLLNSHKRKRPFFDKASKKSLRRYFKLARYIKKLDFSRATNLDTGHVTRIVDKCNQLRSIDLDDCVNISNRDVSGILRCCPQLESLSLARCTRLTAGLFFHQHRDGVPIAASLYALNLGNNPDFFTSIEQAIIRQLPRPDSLMLPSLKSFVLGHMRSISDEDIAEASLFFQECPALTTLTCFNTNPPFIEDILSLCKDISSLTFVGATRITRGLLEELATVRPLIHLDIRMFCDFECVDHRSSKELHHVGYFDALDTLEYAIDDDSTKEKENIGGVFADVQLHQPTCVSVLLPINMVNALQQRQALGPWLTCFRTSTALTEIDLQTLSEHCPSMIDFHVSYNHRDRAPDAILDALDAWKNTLTHLSLDHCRGQDWLLRNFESRPQLSRNLVFYSDEVLELDIETLERVKRVLPSLQYLGFGFIRVLSELEEAGEDEHMYAEFGEPGFDYENDWYVFVDAVHAMNLRGFYSHRLLDTFYSTDLPQWEIHRNIMDGGTVDAFNDLVYAFISYFYGDNYKY